MGSNYYGGCDVGSTYGKAVIMDENGKVVSCSILVSKLDPEETAQATIQEAIANTGNGIAKISDLKYLVGTGYGRQNITFANENISEISCHAMGVHAVAPNVKTIMDFGGQDLKGISVDTDGSVLNFVMNDKCAAGTGRFFDAMARAFEMSIADFSLLSIDAKEEVPISSQCSVFAETEVISMIAKKKNAADIALGIEKSVARRAYSLLRGAGIRPDITVTGGCAKNRGLIDCLEKMFNLKIVSLPVDPQLMGAVGAAEYARRKSK
jgi:predicted CoA-substrate-specific enzyme activase